MSATRSTVRGRATGVAGSLGSKCRATKVILEGHCSAGRSDVRCEEAEIGQDGAWRSVPGDGAVGFAEQYRHFATSIASGQLPQTGGRYARHVMDILFAAEESSVSGRGVLLADFNRRP